MWYQKQKDKYDDDSSKGFPGNHTQVVLGALACYARLTNIIATLIYIRVGVVSFTDYKLVWHEQTRTRDFGIAQFTYKFQ